MRMGVSVCRFKEEGVCLRRLINFGKMIRPAANVSREKTTREPSTVSANQALPSRWAAFPNSKWSVSLSSICAT